MAVADDWLSENSACEENCSSRQDLNVPTSDNVRIVLFKEGRLKECQLLFDSFLYNAGKNGAVSALENLTNAGRKQVEENLHLSEMIFGSTAMSYNETYFKMHDVSSPHRIIFTQVFPMPNRRNIRQKDNVSSTKVLLNTRTFNLEQWNKIDSIKSLSGHSSSRGSTLQSLGSLTNTNSTTATMDSGFSDQYSASDLSSWSGFSLNQVISSESMNSASDLSSQDSLLQRGRRSLRHPRLGLALIIPYSTGKDTHLDFFMENINFVHKLLNRLRRYVDIAYKAPEAFISVMLETSVNSAHWISNLTAMQKNGNAMDKSLDPSQSSRFGMCSFGKTLKEKFNSWTVRAIGLKKRVQTGLFRNLLTDVETKDRNFFLSTILTTVLTYHPGWIRTCFKYSLDSGFVPRNSYNALWWQLMDLCQTFGSVNINSRIVISGCDATMIDRILNFIRYFIRYSKVVKQDFNRVGVSEDNKEVDMICDGLDSARVEDANQEAGILKKNKKASYDLSKLLDDDTSEFFPSQHENSVMFILGEDEKLVDLKKTDLSTKIYKSNYCEKGGTLMRSKKTLSDLSSLINWDDCLNEDKGKNQLTKRDVVRVKMKVLRFPLPKIQTSDFSEMFSQPLALRRNSSDKIVPDIILQGSAIPLNILVDELRHGLSSQCSCASGSTEDEAVAILGDVEKWRVKVISNKRYAIRGSTLCDNMDPSDLVSGMLDVLLHMGNLNIPKQYCMAHVEQSLLEICLRSSALAKLLLNVEFGSIDLLVSALDIKASDIPLLMSVVSQIEPEVSQKYGLSYQ